jgi:hypothetical protein
MLLRASSAVTNATVNLQVIADGTTATPSGVPHGETLLAFAEAVVGEDEVVLAHARHRVLDELGPAALVDAAAIAANFERMVRIADSTGIPLDTVVHERTKDERAALRLDQFGSAANTSWDTSS